MPDHVRLQHGKASCCSKAMSSILSAVHVQSFDHPPLGRIAFPCIYRHFSYVPTLAQLLYNVSSYDRMLTHAAVHALRLGSLCCQHLDSQRHVRPQSPHLDMPHACLPVCTASDETIACQLSLSAK